MIVYLVLDRATNKIVTTEQKLWKMPKKVSTYKIPRIYTNTKGNATRGFRQLVINTMKKEIPNTPLGTHIADSLTVGEIIDEFDKRFEILKIYEDDEKQYRIERLDFDGYYTAHEKTLQGKGTFKRGRDTST